MRAEVINSFILSARRVLEKELQVGPKVGKVGLKDPDSEPVDILCKIDLSGTVTGCVIIGLPDKLADRFNSLVRNRGVSNGASVNRIKSGAQIASLITGAVKKELREKEITLSPPQIIPDTGAHQFPETAPVITIPIETGKGNVFIDISYAERVNGGRIIEECL